MAEQAARVNGEKASACLRRGAALLPKIRGGYVAWSGPPGGSFGTCAVGALCHGYDPSPTGARRHLLGASETLAGKLFPELLAAPPAWFQLVAKSAWFAAFPRAAYSPTEDFLRCISTINDTSDMTREEIAALMEAAGV